LSSNDDVTIAERLFVWQENACHPDRRTCFSLKDDVTIAERLFA